MNQEENVNGIAVVFMYLAIIGSLISGYYAWSLHQQMKQFNQVIQVFCTQAKIQCGDATDVPHFNS